MANIPGEIVWQANDDAWFTTNASEVFEQGITIYHTDGRYKFTDGVTALSALLFLGGGGGSTQNLQQVINESPTVDGVVFQSLDGNTKAEISDAEINFTGLIKKNSEEIAVVEIQVTTDLTAENDKHYVLVSSAVFTDPTPVTGKGYTILLSNLQTATVGGVAYGGTNGNIVKRYYIAGAWVTRSFYSNEKNVTLFSPIASPTFTGTVTTPAIIVSSETASTIASFDASKNIKSLSTGTYPSLTELAYLKGVTSAIQTQLNNKGNSQPIYSGKWRTIPYVGIPTTVTGNHGTIFYMPYIVSSTHTVTDIGIEVSTAAIASNVRLALYSDNNGVPGTLIEESGAISANTLGLKTYTFTSPIVLSASNQVYWMAVQASAAGIGLRATATAVSNFYILGTGNSGSLYTQTQAFGAFPATATGTIFAASSSYVPVLKAQ